MTHVLDALGRIKEYWGSVALADLDDYAQGRIIRGGAVDWEALAIGTPHQLLKVNVAGTMPAWASFVWNQIGSGAGADMVHDHTTNPEGGTHWGGQTQAFGGGSGVNVVTLPDHLAQAWKIVDDGVAAPAAIEYVRIVTLNVGPSQAVFFNNGEVDVDFRVAASGITNALFVQGSDGFLGNTNPPGYPVHFTYASTTLGQFEYVVNTVVNNTNVLFNQIAILGELDITHSGVGAAGDIQLYAVAGTVRVRGASDSASSARDVNVFRASGFNYNTGTVDVIAGFGLDMRNLAAGTITHLPALDVTAAQNTGGGAITNFYGLRIAATVAAGTNYGVHQSGAGMFNYFAGDVGVRTTTPDYGIQLGDGAAVIADAGNTLTIGPDQATARLILQGTGQADAIFVDSGAGANDKIMQLLCVSGVTEFRSLSDALGIQADHIIVMDHSSGSVGLSTGVPSRILDCNDGSGNMIADGYDNHPSWLANKVDPKPLGDVLTKFKQLISYQYKRIPYVSADELAAAGIKEFGKERWGFAFPDGHRGGKLQDCLDPEIKAFLDQLGDKLRAERQGLPEWQRLHYSLAMDDLVDTFPDILSRNADGSIDGYSLNNYVGLLHACITELLARVERLE